MYLQLIITSILSLTRFRKTKDVEGRKKVEHLINETHIMHKKKIISWIISW